MRPTVPSHRVRIRELRQQLAGTRLQNHSSPKPRPGLKVKIQDLDLRPPLLQDHHKEFRNQVGLVIHIGLPVQATRIVGQHQLASKTLGKCVSRKIQILISHQRSIQQKRRSNAIVKSQITDRQGPPPP